MLPIKLQELRSYLLSRKFITVLEYSNLRDLNLPRKKKKAYKTYLKRKHRLESLMLKEISKIERALPEPKFKEGGISMSNPNRSVFVDNSQKILDRLN